jgi:hypothetical protein
MAASTVIQDPVSESMVADGISHARWASAGNARHAQNGNTIHLSDVFMGAILFQLKA